MKLRQHQLSKEKKKEASPVNENVVTKEPRARPLSPLEGSGSRQHIGLPSYIWKIHLSRPNNRSKPIIKE